MGEALQELISLEASAMHDKLSTRASFCLIGDAFTAWLAFE
jgi:hypothetical protein